MSVTICLTTYNGEKYIEEQLNSIINQTCKDWLLKIRDDGSIDNTVNILQRYAQKHKDKIQIIGDKNENIGLVQSFALLIASCVSDYIMLCDQDDVWFKDKVELSLTAIKNLEAQIQKPAPLLIFSDLKVVDENLNTLSESFWKTQKIMPEICHNYNKLLALNVVTGCTMMFNQHSVPYILPMPDFLKVHDGWIATNIAYYGKLDYIKIPTLLYRQHNVNVFGAHSVDSSYFWSKINFRNFNNFKLYINSFSFKVSLLKVVLYKTYYSILRLLKSFFI